MSIATALQNASAKVAAAYTSCNNKGATMPASADQNLSHLSATLDSINTDYPFNQTVQKVIKVENNGVVTYERDEEYVGSITQLANNKYKNNTSLVSALIPDTVVTIGGNSFQGCTSLNFVNLDNVTTISAYAFQGCTSLEHLYLPNTLTSIGDHAFENCTALKIDLDLPSTITTLYSATFHNAGIRTVKLRISSFASDATFSECANLVSVDLSESTVTGLVNVYTEARGTFAQCHALKSVILPTTCTEISKGAFYVDDSLETVTGMDNVTIIKNNGFRDCLALTSLYLDKVETLEGYSLNHTGLITVELPAIVSISGSNYGGSAFYNCKSMTSIDIGPNCTFIGALQFGSCSSLTKVIMRATTPPQLDNSNAFNGTPSSLKIYVPYSSNHSVLTTYQTATNWSSHASKMIELNPDGTLPV